MSRGVMYWRELAPRSDVVCSGVEWRALASSETAASVEYPLAAVGGVQQMPDWTVSEEARMADWLGVRARARPRRVVVSSTWPHDPECPVCGAQSGREGLCSACDTMIEHKEDTAE
jgi:hypothetical protein